MKDTQPTQPETESAGKPRKSKGGRNYVRKGFRNGGKREGAGRPEGSSNALPLGAVEAIKSLRYRVPEGAPEVLADVAGEAFATVVGVMRGEYPDGFARMAAAKHVREEVCGPLAQKHLIGGAEGEKPLEVVIRDLAKEEP